MRHVTMTEFKQRASRILDDRKPTAILRNSKIEGYYCATLLMLSWEDCRATTAPKSNLKGIGQE